MSLVPSLYAARILTEAAAVGLVTAWGFHAAAGAAGWLLAGACAALPLACWGRYVAPRSATRLDDPARLAVELALFLTVALAAGDMVSPVVGVVFFVVASAGALALRLLDSPRHEGRSHGTGTPVGGARRPR